VRETDLELAGLLEAVARRTATGKCGAGDPVRVAAVAVAVAVAEQIAANTEVTR